MSKSRSDPLARRHHASYPLLGPKPRTQAIINAYLAGASIFEVAKSHNKTPQDVDRLLRWHKVPRRAEDQQVATAPKLPTGYQAPPDHEDRRICLKQFVRKIERYYGMIYAEYLFLMDSQDWKCAICKRKLIPGCDRKVRPCIDHCHKTGKSRGILCGGCNLGLGSFQDNPKSLSAAIEYLRQFS